MRKRWRAPVNRLTTTQRALRIVDNGPGEPWRREIDRLCAARWGARANVSCEVLSPGRNLGFGEGHNTALKGSRVEVSFGYWVRTLSILRMRLPRQLAS